jgi:hypothetical protein
MHPLCFRRQLDAMPDNSLSPVIKLSTPVKNNVAKSSVVVRGIRRDEACLYPMPEPTLRRDQNAFVRKSNEIVILSVIAFRVLTVESLSF